VLPIRAAPDFLLSCREGSVPSGFAAGEYVVYDRNFYTFHSVSKRHF